MHYPTFMDNSISDISSDSRYHFLAEAMPQKVWTADKDGNVTYFNRHWLEYTGQTFEELKAWDAGDIIHPDDQEKNIQLWKHSIATGEDFQFEQRIRRYDGEYRWHLSRGKAQKDAAGNILFWVGTNTDIHELKTLARQYYFVMNTAPQLVWITDPKGFHEYFNQRWVEYTGYTVEDSLGTEMWNNLLHPDDQERAKEVWAHSLATGEPYEIEYRFKRASDGAWRWFLGRALPMRDELGKIIKWFGTCTDIHDLKKSQEKLRRSEERYELAAKATKDAIWDWNLLSNELSWNPAIESVYGYPLEEVPPTVQWWYEHLHPADAERVVSSIHLAIDAGETKWKETYRFRTANGNYLTVEDSGYIAKDETGKPVRMIGAMQDVTERLQAQENLKRYYEDLEVKVTFRNLDLEQEVKQLREQLKAKEMK
jgi:PAS domain S-box-containing protein